MEAAQKGAHKSLLSHFSRVRSHTSFFAERSFPPIQVVGHENVAKRFDRYKKTGGYNSKINTRQFQVETTWPSEFRYPDISHEAL